MRRLAETLDLITFFTAGEKETRAWTLRRGQTAIDAAATIHTDIARGFIRCEVTRGDDLLAARSHAVSRARLAEASRGATYVDARRRRPPRSLQCLMHTYPPGKPQGRDHMNRIGLLVAAVACVLVATSFAGAATTVSSPVRVTDDQFAANEESLGMDPTGRVMLGMSRNNWHFNDGCGISYSTDGGATWAPESFAPFTAFTNDPNIPGTGTFAVAGDPVVVYNPKSGLFDVICQAFGAPAHQIQLLSTTFDVTKANPSLTDSSYGLSAWRLPTMAITTGTANGSQKGSNGKFPDHEAGTVDTGRGAGHHYGRVYVAWAEFNGQGRSPIDLAYSDNDGATWTGPIHVSDAGHQFDQDATPRVGPDGTVYVSFTNGPNEKSTKNNAAMIAKSTDGGNTWSQSYVAAPIPAPATGLPNALYRGGTDVTSTVDQSTGKVVVVYNDTSSGALNVWTTHTAVAGDLSSFTPAQRVKPSGQTQFFPWLQSAPNGRVDLALLRPELRRCGRPQLRHALLVDGLRRVVDEHGGDDAGLRRRHVWRVPRVHGSAGLHELLPRRLHRGRPDQREGAGDVDRQRIAHPRRLHREGRLLT